MIKENLLNIEERIVAACIRSGRKRDTVKLIAVSKTKPVDMITDAYNNGIRDFGENKVQELCSKYELINESDINWHLIGNLQRNKVRQVVSKTKLIHSVDSFKLAEEISKEVIKQGLAPVNILIEINIANEPTKHGVDIGEVKELIHDIAMLPGIVIKGFMTVAPYTDEPENNRKYFRKMYELYVDMQAENKDNINITELSMGMSGDFEIAIEEGATIVRIGTGIFGERSYL